MLGGSLSQLCRRRKPLPVAQQALVENCHLKKRAGFGGAMLIMPVDYVHASVFGVNCVSKRT